MRKIKNSWIGYMYSVLYKESKWLLFLDIVLSVFSALIPLMQTVALASLIDTSIQMQQYGFSLSAVLPPLIVILILLLISNYNGKIKNLIAVSFVNRLREDYTMYLHEKYAKLEYRYLEDPESLDLFTRVIDAPEQKIYDCLQNVLSMISTFITILSLAFVIVYYNWYIGLLLVIATIPLLVVAVHGGRATYEANKLATKYQRKYQYYGEVLTSREASVERTVFGYGTKLNETWKENFETARKVNFVTISKWILKSTGYGVISILILAVVIVCLIIMTISGRITIGIFSALINAIYKLTGGMTYELSSNMESLVKNKKYIDEIKVFLEKAETDGVTGTPHYPPLVFESLQFKNVWFKYPGVDTYILKGMSFVLEKGRHYSFVGVNGAGKSTIIKLITGLYTNYEGEILLNGKPLSTYSQSDLKSVCAVAFQDFSRYFISVRDNIAIGNINNMDGDDEIGDAVQALYLDELIESLPQGLYSNLGKLSEDGIDISGGQWQKLALARFYVNPGTLRILDEPTAALDPIHESRIYHDFEKLSKNKTAIFISHRLGSTRLADTIFVLHDGTIVEKGSHSELLEQNEIYAEMFESQRMWYL